MEALMFFYISTKPHFLEKSGWAMVQKPLDQSECRTF